MGYDVQDYTGAPPILFGDRPDVSSVLWQDQVEIKDKSQTSILTNSQLCFYNVCPYATQRKSAWVRADWMSFTVTAAEPGERPPGAGENDTNLFQEGGCVLAAVQRPERTLDVALQGDLNQVIQGLQGDSRPFSSSEAAKPEARVASSVGADASADTAANSSAPDQKNYNTTACREQLKKEFMEVFTTNRKALAANWQVLQRSLSNAVLPGAPPEVIWQLAEAAERMLVSTGHEVVSEGDDGDDGESLIVIDSGVATVEKKMPDKERETIGRLRSGAIIGDLCLIAAAVPRAATVRAKTDVEAIKVPTSAFADTLCRLPGALASCEDHLMDAGNFIMEGLLTRTEVASSLNLFQGCDLRFVNDIANAGEQRTVLCGRAVVEQGNTSGTLFVLEHGRCIVEVSGLGKVGEVPAGNCFGERTLLGISKEANATVRVSNPVALILAIPRTALLATLAAHPEEQEHFDTLRRTPMVGRVQGSKVRHVELFRPCKTDFLEVLNRSIEARGYMPGSTIVVEGQEDVDPKMFVLTGGMVVAERRGRQMARMSPGATFGELAMLGVTKQRAVTVRAMNFCFVMGICRSAFFAAIDEYPEEEDHFQQVLSNNHYYAGAMWPCLQNVPTRLLYLLDLYAEPRRVQPGDTTLTSASGALLLLEGEVTVLDSDKKELVLLKAGSCFNEQILVGAKEEQGVTLVPKTFCDVRILTKLTWQKVMDEFPEEQGRAKSAVLRYKAEQAEKMLGRTPGGIGALRHAGALFATAGEKFVETIRGIVETRLYEPHVLIAGDTVEEEAGEPEFFLLLEGEVFRQDGLGKSLVPLGTALGESTLLGVESGYPCSWYSGRGTCTVQVLGKSAFNEVLASFPPETTLVQDLLAQVSDQDCKEIWKRLQWSTPFRALRPSFISALAKGADIQIYARGNIILHQGEPCKLGESYMCLVLGGKVLAVGDVGTVFGSITAGEVLGEVGAFGLTPCRTTTTKCSEEGLVCAARFRGPAIANALKEHPAACESLSVLFSQLESSNKAIEEQRKNWLQEVAVPALGRTPLLAGCPVDFLLAVAVTLSETPFAPGQCITILGEPLKAMLVILEGTAEMLSKAGVRMGCLSAGSAFGEVAALGLFSSCMAVLRALTPCKVLLVTEEALRGALARCAEGGEMTERFRSLVVSRHEQVARGVPMSALSIAASPDDVSVRAISLLSELICLEPGDVWEPVPDFDPCGPCFGVLVQGRATVEMSNDHHQVITLYQGSLFLEGLAAEFGARVRADTRCEAYRVRRSDFMMCVTSNPAAQDWVWRFKLEERNVRSALRLRLENAKGLLEGGVPHLKDREIQAWNLKKRQNTSKAKWIQKERSEPILPMLAKTQPASFRTAGGPRLQATAAAKPPQGLRYQALGLRAYGALQLPRLPHSQVSSPSTAGRKEGDGGRYAATGARWCQGSPAEMSRAKSTPALPAPPDS
jgi:CRP-like cAMP-binding protein